MREKVLYFISSYIHYIQFEGLLRSTELFSPPQAFVVRTEDCLTRIRSVVSEEGAVTLADRQNRMHHGRRRGVIVTTAIDAFAAERAWAVRPAPRRGGGRPGWGTERRPAPGVSVQGSV